MNSHSRPHVQIWVFVVIIQVKSAAYAPHILNIFIAHYKSIIKTQKMDATNSQAEL